MSRARSGARRLSKTIAPGAPGRPARPGTGSRDMRGCARAVSQEGCGGVGLRGEAGATCESPPPIRVRGERNGSDESEPVSSLEPQRWSWELSFESRIPDQMEESAGSVAREFRSSREGM